MSYVDDSIEIFQGKSCYGVCERVRREREVLCGVLQLPPLGRRGVQIHDDDFLQVQFPSIRQALTMTNCRRMKTGESTLELSRPSFPNDLSVSFWHSKYLKTNRRARVERLHENRKNAALYVCWNTKKINTKVKTLFVVGKSFMGEQFSSTLRSDTKKLWCVAYLYVLMADNASMVHKYNWNSDACYTFVNNLTMMAMGDIKNVVYGWLLPVITNSQPSAALLEAVPKLAFSFSPLFFLLAELMVLWLW